MQHRSLTVTVRVYKSSIKPAHRASPARPLPRSLPRRRRAADPIDFFGSMGIGRELAKIRFGRCAAVKVRLDIPLKPLRPLRGRKSAF